MMYKKGINYWDDHDGVVTYLELDILECEVQWALGSVTKLVMLADLAEVLEFQLSYFKS